MAHGRHGSLGSWCEADGVNVGLIEQAAKRLDELKRAGVELPQRSDGATDRAHEADAKHAPRTPERLMRSIESGGRADEMPRTMPDASRGQTVKPAAAGEADTAARRSKEVVLDLARLSASGFVTSSDARSKLADEFRVIKRPLLSNAQGRSAAPIERANLIMVTSALPGEGKTFTAINLAMSMAMELDNTVLLVDADVARPSVPERLGIEAPTGLLDLLISPGLDVADVLLKTNVERLSILPAGRPQSRATELLASDGMYRLLAELASRYSDRILIFDAPPLLPSTESRVLAAHMGQVVVVVEASRTSQTALSQALATIESCPVVMTLLNKARRSEVGSYYGYYGAYGTAG